MINLKLSTLLLLVAVSMISCKEKHEEYHNIIDKIEAKSTDYKRDSTFFNNKFDVSDLVIVKDADPHFYIKDRKKDIESYA